MLFVRIEEGKKVTGRAPGNPTVISPGSAFKPICYAVDRTNSDPPPYGCSSGYFHTTTSGLSPQAKALKHIFRRQPGNPVRRLNGLQHFVSLSLIVMLFGWNNDYAYANIGRRIIRACTRNSCFSSSPDGAPILSKPGRAPLGRALSLSSPTRGMLVLSPSICTSQMDVLSEESRFCPGGKSFGSVETTTSGKNKMRSGLVRPGRPSRLSAYMKTLKGSGTVKSEDGSDGAKPPKTGGAINAIRRAFGGTKGKWRRSRSPKTFEGVLPDRRGSGKTKFSLASTAINHGSANGIDSIKPLRHTGSPSLREVDPLGNQGLGGGGDTDSININRRSRLPSSRGLGSDEDLGPNRVVTEHLSHRPPAVQPPPNRRIER